jgi:hypothetical protein
MQLIRIDLGVNLGGLIFFLMILTVWSAGLVGIGMGIQKGLGTMIKKILIGGLAVAMFSIIFGAIGVFLWVMLFVK